MGTALKMPVERWDMPGQESDYFVRTPERLVLEGYRHWVAGFDNGSIAPWELAWDLYETILGADHAKSALSELAHFIRTTGRCATCPLRSFPTGARHLCRDECLTLGLIAGAQHGDDSVVGKCLEAMTCPARREPVALAAGSFALTLRALNQRLLPIPAYVVDDIVTRSRPATFH